MADTEPKVDDEMVGGEEEGNDEVCNLLQRRRAVR
jgi:hypothetical protein